MSLQKLFKQLPSLSIRPQIPNPPLSLFHLSTETLQNPHSLSPSDPKSQTQTPTGITTSEKEKMDKENTHRQSSKPKEKNEERKVMTEREDGRKEIEEMSARKEEHFHPSIRQKGRTRNERSSAKRKSCSIWIFDMLVQLEAKGFMRLRGCLLVRQSFFHDDLRNFTDVGGDVSTTMILTPGLVIDFLLANQNALEPRNIDWAKQLFTPIRIERWAVVNFSAHCDTSHLSLELINCGTKWHCKYPNIECPHTLVEEDPQYRRSSPIVRVEKMFELIIGKLPAALSFFYVPCQRRKILIFMMKKSLSDFGIATQCISPTKINDQYLTNVLLKINSKV
ncbi:hypothetical protein ACSBR2_008105 [Camellia fascicularis]